MSAAMTVLRVMNGLSSSQSNVFEYELPEAAEAFTFTDIVYTRSNGVVGFRPSHSLGGGRGAVIGRMKSTSSFLILEPFVSVRVEPPPPAFTASVSLETGTITPSSPRERHFVFLRPFDTIDIYHLSIKIEVACRATLTTSDFASPGLGPMSSMDSIDARDANATAHTKPMSSAHQRSKDSTRSALRTPPRGTRTSVAETPQSTPAGSHELGSPASHSQTKKRKCSPTISSPSHRMNGTWTSVNKRSRFVDNFPHGQDVPSKRKANWSGQTTLNHDDSSGGDGKTESPNWTDDEDHDRDEGEAESPAPNMELTSAAIVPGSDILDAHAVAIEAASRSYVLAQSIRTLDSETRSFPRGGPILDSQSRNTQRALSISEYVHPSVEDEPSLVAQSPRTNRSDNARVISNAGSGPAFSRRRSKDVEAVDELQSDPSDLEDHEIHNDQVHLHPYDLDFAGDVDSEDENNTEEGSQSGSVSGDYMGDVDEIAVAHPTVSIPKPSHSAPMNQGPSKPRAQRSGRNPKTKTPISSYETAISPTKTPRLVLSGTRLDAACRRWLATQDVTIVDDNPGKRSHYICVVHEGSLPRTSKVLKALIANKFVVTSSWVSHSKKQGRLLDLHSYIPKELQGRIAVGHRSKIFANKILFFTNAAAHKYGQHFEDVKEIAFAAGASEVEKGSAHKGANLIPKNRVVLLGEADEKDSGTRQLISEYDRVVFDKALLAQSIVRAELKLESSEFRLSLPLLDPSGQKT